MTLNDLLSNPNGYFRRIQAEQYPDDPRNLEAAHTLDRIAAELPDYEGGHYHSTLETLWERYGEDGGARFSEILSELGADVGFRCDLSGANEYLEEAISRLEKDGPYYVRNAALISEGDRV